MNLSQWATPAGFTAGGLGLVVTAAMVLGFQRRQQEQSFTVEERAELAHHRRQALQRRLAMVALAVGCIMMFVIAGIAAWLSFGAQREYAHAHNGGDWNAATAFALLLDAGALSLSLIRFFEALTLRSSAVTRLLLFGFVLASAQMNLLHAPEDSLGGTFLAAIPPLVYAVLLEMLLHKIEQVVMGRQKRRAADEERGYSLLLWVPWPVGAPLRMWKAWRSDLIATIDNVRAPGSLRAQAPAAQQQLAESPNMHVPDLTQLERVGSAHLPPGSTSTPHPEVRESGHAPQAAIAARPAMGTHQAAPAAPAPASVAAEPSGSDITAPDASQADGADPAAPPSASSQGDTAEPKTGMRAYERTADHPDHGGWGEGARDGASAQPTAPPRRRLSPRHAEAEPDQRAAKDEHAEVEQIETSQPDIEHAKTTDHHDRTHTVDNDQDQERPNIQIDLSSLPAGEGPRQRAERIYVAHQAAGLPLDRADLARWAGYKNPASGRVEYNRLEKLYGPILEKEGAGYLDLDWSRLEQLPAASSSNVA
ncbi:DUF2637 domain-containing protein (plasmid) [Streptomyces sp. NBC_00445]|uniref:DUF2637 domain-containing protein n=1 Tax=Streptomyces sp. NBC_00445 TaxID=2975745 RepID=UPI002E1FEA36